MINKGDVIAGDLHGRGKLGGDRSNEQLSHTKTTRGSSECDAVRDPIPLKGMGLYLGWDLPVWYQLSPDQTQPGLLG